jgi:phosphatidylserine decarboxylase
MAALSYHSGIVMRIHREGHSLILWYGLGLSLLNGLLYFFLNRAVSLVSLILSALSFLFLVSFFRSPRRTAPNIPHAILAPADGRIVTIERVVENEFFQGERLMISIFMSVFNVHQNWVPCAGKVVYRRYHVGKYLVAFHPKSSELNERCTVVIRHTSGECILVRQIAGLLARRIKTYLRTDQTVRAGEELGFIKFGSRVDVFLPVDSLVKVSLYQNVTGSQTILAEIPSNSQR